MNQCLDLLERLAAGHVGLNEFGREIRTAIKRAVGFDGWCLGLADPRSRLPNAAVVHDSPLGDRLPQFWRFEFGRPSQGTAAMPLDSVVAATARQDAQGKRRIAELLRPGGVGDELRVPLVADRMYWGSLGLFRSGGGRAFSQAEIDSATVLMPALTAGVVGAWAASAWAPGADAIGQPGTILLDRDGGIVSQTPEAQDWLARMGPWFAHAMLPALVAMLETRPTTSLRTRAADGLWVRVSGGRLVPAAGVAVIAVTMQTAAPAEITPLLLRAYGLTPRQRAVTRMLLTGQSSQQIASALHLSPHTVNDHVKAIEAKVGAHSRGELVALLTGQAT